MQEVNGVTLGLKIDVDTLVGYQNGVPALLNQLEAAGVRASFFFSVGPDRSGVAIRRLFTQRGFLGKMIRNRTPATYGLRTLLYGTLLPAPLIVAADPGIVRAVAAAGHEVGVHAWDHIDWHDGVRRMSRKLLREQLARAFAELTDITGTQPRSFAAPGWQCCREALAHHDDMGLIYASDVRGRGGVILPRLDGQAFETPQVPTSLPTLDEMWGREVHNGTEAAAEWCRLLALGINVLTAHAEIEGMAMRGALPAFLQMVAERGAAIGTLREIVEATDRSGLCAKEIAAGRLPGRAGYVSSVVD